MSAATERDRIVRTEALRTRGIERYAAGDLHAATTLWREALDLAPEDIQVRAYVEWAEARMAIENPVRGGLPLPVSPVPDRVFPEEAVEAITPLHPPDDGRANSPDATMTWYPSASGALEERLVDTFEGAEAPVRRFLAHTTTRPNLVPLDDVPVLSEEHLAELAGMQRHEDGGREAPHSRRSSTTRPGDSGPVMAAAPADPATIIEMELEMEIEAEPAPPARVEPQAAPLRTWRDPAARRPGSPFGERVVAARRAIDAGDLETAVDLAEEVVAAAGGLEAPALQEHASTLTLIYERLLGRRERRIRLGRLPPDLDPRSAFLLSRVDGSFTIDDLMDVSGMERASASRLAALLLRSGALVAFD